jgi:hypothetical protein
VAKSLALTDSGHVQVKWQQSDDAKEPRLPHPPGKGAHQGKGREHTGSKGLSGGWQQRDEHENQRPRESQQQHTHHPKFKPGLQEYIVAVVPVCSRVHKAFWLLASHGGPLLVGQNRRRFDAYAEERMPKRLSARVFPRRLRQPAGRCSPL